MRGNGSFSSSSTSFLNMLMEYIRLTRFGRLTMTVIILLAAPCASHQTGSAHGSVIIYLNVGHYHKSRLSEGVFRRQSSGKAQLLQAPRYEPPRSKTQTSIVYAFGGCEKDLKGYHGATRDSFFLDIKDLERESSTMPYPYHNGA